MLGSMSLAERVTSLQVEIDGYELERRRVEVSSEFARVTTTVVPIGAGLRLAVREP